MTSVRDKARDTKRIPLHKQNVFEAESRPGYKRYWINETPGEVDRYILAGWAVVQTDMKTHDGLSQVESQMDSAVRRVVNKDVNAPCRTAVLMEIPLEYYEEDQTAEQQEIDEKERSFDAKGVHKQVNGYGTIDIVRN